MSHNNALSYIILVFGNHQLQLVEENAESLSLANKPATEVAGYTGLMMFSFAILAILFLFASAAFAAIPNLLNIQGKLTDINDEPKTGEFTFIFGIYNISAGGTPLWSETKKLNITNAGYFSTLLGSTTALNLTFDQQYYLEINVDGQTLLPRYTIGSTAYAFSSNNTQFLSPNATALQNFYVNRSLSVNTTVVQYALNVLGSANITGTLYAGSISGAISVQAANITSGTLSGNFTISDSLDIAKYLNVSGGDFYVNDATGRIGIGTSSPVEKLDVSGNINVTGTINATKVIAGSGKGAPNGSLTIADGTIFAYGTVGVTPAVGAGRRLMWIPEKASFRAGEATGTEWDNSNIGNVSFAVGYQAKASADYSYALGYNAIATGFAAIAIGVSSVASNNYALTFGYSPVASGVQSIAIGNTPTASATNSIAIGLWTMAIGTNSISIGENNTASGFGSIAIGQNNSADGKNAMSFGQFVGAFGNNSIAIGRGTGVKDLMRINDSNAFGIGFNATVPTFYVLGSTTANSTGTVGIGTTAPVTTLDVQGNMNLTGWGNFSQLWASRTDVTLNLSRLNISTTLLEARQSADNASIVRTNANSFITANVNVTGWVNSTSTFTKNATIYNDKNANASSIYIYDSAGVCKVRQFWNGTHFVITAC